MPKGRKNKKRGVRSPDSRLLRDSYYLNLESGDLTPYDDLR
jgi:hypothetical protein